MRKTKLIRGIWNFFFWLVGIFLERAMGAQLPTPFVSTFLIFACFSFVGPSSAEWFVSLRLPRCHTVNLPQLLDDSLEDQFRDDGRHCVSYLLPYADSPKLVLQWESLEACDLSQGEGSSTGWMP